MTSSADIDIMVSERGSCLRVSMKQEDKKAMNDHSAALEAKRREPLAAGVEMMDPGAVYVEWSVTVGAGIKMVHLTYVGDSDASEGCSFGCGAVTCNYDGFQKFRTVTGSHVLVGCNTNFVPPVTAGDGAYIAAGTTVTEDIPPDAMAIGRTRQQMKEGWAAENRKRKAT